MRFDFVVLGATGEEGSIASKDLLNSGCKVLLCGRNRNRIKNILKHKNAEFQYVDVLNVDETASIIKKSGAKIVLNCVELKWNLNVMNTCLKAKVNYLDLGGLQEMTQEQYNLDKNFKNAKLTALLGCGSTPGISNIMASYAAEKLDSIDHIDLGFAWDSNIKKFVLPYSFESIMYEISNEPVVLENGKFVKNKSCYFEGKRKFRGVGEQGIYCIVHSETYTFYKYFKNKGLKEIHYTAGFPKHSYDVIQMLKDLGFGDNKEIIIGNKKIKVVDFSREILKNIEKPKNYREVENVWVEIAGKYKGKNKKILMEALTSTLKGYEFAGSNINTGMSISIMAQLMFKGLINEKGVTAPEVSVQYKPFFQELSKRKIKIYENGKIIN